MVQEDADKKLADTLAAINREELRMAASINRHNVIKADTARLQAKHDNLVQYEQKAWAAMRAKDKELMNRESALQFSDNTLGQARTNLPKLS